MKVLWVTNTIFPDLSKSIGSAAPVVGGWMYGLANDLVKSGVELIVVTARAGINTHKACINGITYYLLKGEKSGIDYDSTLEEQWKNIIKEIKPNVVHIHGTEYAYGLSLIKACSKLNFVVSIQGLVSVYARYYNGSISSSQLKKHRTFRDIYKFDSIIQAQKKFHKRGELVEKEYFKLTNNFIGRTQWDLDHTMTLNKKAIYHFCNESLRDSFYNSRKWNILTKKEHTIFLSQALYPIKGLHQVIKAVDLLKEDFSNIKIRVAGRDIVRHTTIKDKISLNGYGNYVRHLIRKFNLKNHIEFTGYLNENEMVHEYLNCHLFICPSSIENSPNSLGEAQLLGIPCVASYVGGVPDMVEHEKTGLLYRFEEIEMLAESIKKIFLNDSLANHLSKGGIQAATERHDREKNLKKTLSIYSNLSATQ